MKPSLKKRRIAKAHLEGKSRAEIAKVEYPNAKPESGQAMVSKALYDDDTQMFLEQTKLQALKEHKVDWNMLIGKLVDKFNNGKTDNVQLTATSKLMELLESKHVDKDIKEKILSVADSADEVQLVRLMKNK